MFRVVFFGLDGAFSTVPLRLLAAGDLKPVLVVHGVVEPAPSLRPKVSVHKARPGLLDRLQSKFTTEDGEGPRHDLSRAAHAYGIDVLRTAHVGAPKALAVIERARPDAYLVAGFPRLLPPNVLALPRVGGLNIHPGRLPEERGAAPVFWALREGRTEITVTIHILEAGEDSGDVVATTTVPFERGLRGQAILERCAMAAAPLALRGLRDLLRGELVRTPQKREGKGRSPRPNFRDGRVDFAKRAEDVYSFVRACAPTYSLFVEVAGDRFFLRDAISFDPEGHMEFEYVLSGDRLILQCQPGVVELELKEDGALFSGEYTEPDPPRPS